MRDKVLCPEHPGNHKKPAYKRAGFFIDLEAVKKYNKAMNNEELLDKLNRTYLMEEEMAGMLIELCHPESLPDDLPEEVNKRVANILLSIKADTLRHKKIVSEIKKSLL